MGRGFQAGVEEIRQAGVEEIRQKISATLRISDISNLSDRHKDIVNKTTEVLLKQIFLDLVERLGEENAEKYIHLIEDSADPGLIMAFLGERIPDYKNIANKIIEDFLTEMKVAASSAPELPVRTREAFPEIREAFPEQWAATQRDLAIAYYENRIRGERADNLEQAIAHYEKALTVYTRPFPEQWAMTQRLLAIAYRNRIRGERADNLEQAIAHYEKALTVYTCPFPEQWAMTQTALAVAYGSRIRGERADNLEQAIAHYEKALTVYTREAFPEDWADTQTALAVAYGSRIRGERADNLEQAIAHFGQALTVYTRKSFPEDWAMAQAVLAGTYGMRICGERADNLEQAIAHAGQALTVYTREAFPEQWAMDQSTLANAYSERLRGERADNLEQAITHASQALTVHTREAFPADWAMAQGTLAVAYGMRIRGERADNLEQAIAHAGQALTVYTREAFPEHWALAQNVLAGAYLSRIRGERADNLEQAIAHAGQALTVYTREAFPEHWAMAQAALAGAYGMRIRGERADNLEQAIAHAGQALTVYTREAFYTGAAFPDYWATAQNILGDAYLNRIRGERADNLEQAIAHAGQALTVYTRKSFPEPWAQTQNNLGRTYLSRIRGERADNLEQAIAHFGQALTVYTRKSFPTDWATAQNNLAVAYRERIRGERADNLEQAIAHFGQALTVHTRESFPADWAMAQNNLGGAYLRRIRGERADNLEQAIAHFGQALTVYTHEAFPEQWAQTQNTLALAYRERIRGERADNLEQAIAHFGQALTVHTRESFPADWAMAQNNLGGAYLSRIRGERADNLEQAIAHLGQALTVHTRKSFPADWAMAQNTLALAYRERIRGERADNLEQAIAHFGQALTVHTRESFPADWAMAQNNLGGAYLSRIRGERADNLEQAIAHFGQALTVHTRKSFPNEHRRTQRNLGALHFGREDWAHAHAAFDLAIKAGADLLAAAYTEIGRRAEVGESARLYADDAYALLRLGRLGDGLGRLEEGKTRLLSEALVLAALDLTMLAEGDQEALRSARQAVRELEAEMRLPTETPARRRDPELAEALSKTRADLNRRIESIRVEDRKCIPTSLDLPDLVDLIPEGGALVAPLFTSKGSAAFVLPHGTATVTEEHVIELEQFADADLRALLQGPDDEPELGGWLGAYANQDSDWQGWLATIETIGQHLWNRVMGPVHQHLRKFGLSEGAPVLVMPQGGLGLLPLHAAWRAVNGGKRYFLDDYTLTYAPSGVALRTSQRRLGHPRRHQQSLLAIAVDPGTDPRRRLKFHVVESEEIKKLFDPKAHELLVEEEATSEAVIRSASTRSYIHFSCHGFYAWRDPMQSGLVLADGKPLSLADIIARMDLSAARLVTLSACETGLTDIRQSPDEYLGLPAGFLQAGAPAVASSLWPVNDLSTMLLMERFYRAHLVENLAPAPALRVAQRWLRDVTHEELSELFKTYYDTAPDRPRMLYKMAKEHFMRHTFARDRNARPFAHPLYWAAFTFSGF